MRNEINKFNFIEPIPTFIFSNANEEDIKNLIKFRSELQNIILQLDNLNKNDPFGIKILERYNHFLHEAGIILYRIKNFEN